MNPSPCGIITLYPYIYFCFELRRRSFHAPGDDARSFSLYTGVSLFFSYFAFRFKEKKVFCFFVFGSVVVELRIKHMFVTPQIFYTMNFINDFDRLKVIPRCDLSRASQFETP